jgi:hypothetical protein
MVRLGRVFVLNDAESSSEVDWCRGDVEVTLCWIGVKYNAS